jgi:Tol biopolymer transport system component
LCIANCWLQGETKLILYNLNDGKKEVLLSNWSDYTWSEGSLFYTVENRLFKKTISGEAAEILTLEDSNFHGISVSPNQQYFVYSNYHDIKLVDLSTGNTVNLTSSYEDDFTFPKWSPDGNRLLVENKVFKEKDQLTVRTGNFKIIDIASRRISEVKMYDEFAAPGKASWSSDGDKITYDQYGGVFIYHINEDQLVRMTSEDIYADDPKFSSDGTQISFLKSDGEDNGEGNWQNHLYVINVNTGISRKVSDFRSFDAQWNLHSDKILFSSGEGIYIFDKNESSLERFLEVSGPHLVHDTRWINN